MTQSLKLDRFLPYLINVLASRVSRSLGETYGARFGISIAEWRVIAHLAGQDRISVREIYERVDLDKSKISRAAARLEAAGLIEKRVAAADRRLVELRLSRKGRRLFQQIEPLALDYEKQLLSALDPQERKAFVAAMDRLLRAAALSDRNPSQRDIVSSDTT